MFTVTHTRQRGVALEETALTISLALMLTIGNLQFDYASYMQAKIDGATLFGARSYGLGMNTQMNPTSGQSAEQTVITNFFTNTEGLQSSGGNLSIAVTDPAGPDPYQGVPIQQTQFQQSVSVPFLGTFKINSQATEPYSATQQNLVQAGGFSFRVLNATLPEAVLPYHAPLTPKGYESDMYPGDSTISSIPEFPEFGNARAKIPVTPDYNLSLGTANLDFTSAANSIANNDVLPVFNELGCHIDWLMNFENYLYLDTTESTLLGLHATPHSSGDYWSIQSYLWATDTAQNPIDYDPVVPLAVGYENAGAGVLPVPFASEYYLDPPTYAAASANYPDAVSNVLNEVYSWDPAGAPPGGAVTNVPCTQGQPNGVYPKPGSPQLPASVAAKTGLTGYPSGNPSGYPPTIGTSGDSWMSAIW